MKLRNILVISALALAGAAYAADKPVDEIRVYVNPGHGSWTGGDRAMATIKHGPYNSAAPDTTGFFESNTNLWKCLGLVDRLREYGLKFDPTLNQTNPNPTRVGAALDMNNNIVMSHVKLGPYPLSDTENERAFNRNLYEICCEVERNNFDFFISVHSNAHVDGNNTNYPALFVRGENGVAFTEGADTACKTLWPFAYQDEHQCWSNFRMDNPALYYDIDFWHGDYAVNNIDGKTYKGYYGVLRHGVLGFLCEGYFHTYQPARHRAMNVDVCRHEGDGYARGIAAILGIDTNESTGELYGIVRDRHERFRHAYYNCSATSPDANKPVNNAEVILYRDGNEVSRYTTDDEFNGAFVFSHLEPGQYTVTVNAPGYLEAEEDLCGPFTVEAGKTTYPRIYMVSEDYVPPVVTYSDYPDEAAGAEGIFAAPEYSFKRTFTDKSISSLKGKTVKRFITRNNKLYVLAFDAENKPTVAVIDGGNLSTLAVVSTEGCEGTDRALADIQVTADGYLIGCSMELCHLTDGEVEEGETRGECKIYRWANDENGVPTGDPRNWFSTQMTGNLFKAWTGQTMSYSGTYREGRMLLSSASWYYNRKIFFTIIDIVDGAKASESFSNNAEVCDYFNVDDLEEFTFTVSPLSSEKFITQSAKNKTREYSINNMGAFTEVPSDLLSDATAQGAFFRYAGHSMMVAPALDADGKNIGIRLLDITDGLDKAVTIGTANTDIKAVEGISAAVGKTEVERDEEDAVTAAYITLYLLRGDGKITRMTTRGVEQPVATPAYAFALSQQELSGPRGIVLRFSLTDDATAHIRLRGADDTVVDLPSQQFNRGENTYNFNFDTVEFPDGEYTWEVVVENKAVAGIKQLMSVETAGNGVAVDNNPASPHFGNAYFTLNAGNRGIMQYNAMLEPQNDTPYQSGVWDLSVGASCWRGATLEDGTLLVADWGDKQGGIYLFDPANPTAERQPLFRGTQTPSSGEIRNDQGQVIAGSTSGMWPLGAGENQRLYSFQEDYPSDYSLTMVHYNIGTSHEITTIPDATYPVVSEYLINGNVNVVAKPQAMFLSQTRGAGNNARGVPVFLIADYDQNILYNSGADWETLNGGDGALAVNEDASLMAVSDATEFVHVLAVTWEPQFKLEHLYSFDLGTTASTYQMAFDRAGRLYVANRAFNAVYAVPQPAAEAVTPSGLSFHAVSGIGNITVDADMPVEYYNLQGIRVAADKLTPGIYIRRQGNKVTKVLVR